MWFTDATIAFVKEVRANLEDTKKQNAKLEKELAEQLELVELGKKQEELYADLLQRLTQDYYPGILDEIED